jgi:septal ring factor EnvC (AmiA/AmiB activator)
LPIKKKEETMKQIIKDLKAVKKDLLRLSNKTNKMKNRLQKLEKEQATMKSRKKAGAEAKPTKVVPKKSKRVFASRVLLEIITKSKSKKGVDTATLIKKSGFDERKIWNVINSLKSQRKIKSAGRGFYIKT